MNVNFVFFLFGSDCGTCVNIIAQQLSVYIEINLISVVIVPLNVIYLFRNQKTFKHIARSKF